MGHIKVGIVNQLWLLMQLQTSREELVKEVEELKTKVGVGTAGRQAG